MGLNIDDDDVQELLNEHRNGLATEELIDLQNAQIRVLNVEHSSQEEQVREEATSIQIKCMCSSGVRSRSVLRSAI